MNRPEDGFERELSGALRRAGPPEGFASRVMERAVMERQAKVRVMPQFRLWAGWAIAAVLVMGAFVGDEAYERSQEQKAVVARQQFDAAMRVTDHALEQTRVQLERAGLKLGD